MKNHFFPFLEIFFFQKQLACLLPSKAKLALEVYVVERRSIIRLGISTAGQSLVNYYFLPSPLSHRFTVRSGFSAWGKKLQKKKSKNTKKSMPRTLFASTTRATAVIHDGQYQPRPLKQPRN